MCAGKPAAEAEPEPQAEDAEDAEMEEAVDLPAVAAAIGAFMQQREFAGSCTLDEVAAHLQQSGQTLAPPALRQVSC